MDTHSDLKIGDDRSGTLTHLLERPFSFLTHKSVTVAIFWSFEPHSPKAKDGLSTTLGQRHAVSQYSLRTALGAESPEGNASPKAGPAGRQSSAPRETSKLIIPSRNACHGIREGTTLSPSVE